MKSLSNWLIEQQRIYTLFILNKEYIPYLHYNKILFEYNIFKKFNILILFFILKSILIVLSNSDIFI